MVHALNPLRGAGVPHSSDGRPMIRTGIGGWTYPDWRGGVFYPEGLAHKRELECATRADRRDRDQRDLLQAAEAAPASANGARRRPRASCSPQGLALRHQPQGARDRGRSPATGSSDRGSMSWATGWGRSSGSSPPTKRFEADDIAAFSPCCRASSEAVPLRHAIEVGHESFACAEFVEIARAQAWRSCGRKPDRVSIADRTAIFAICAASEPEPPTVRRGLIASRLCRAGDRSRRRLVASSCDGAGNGRCVRLDDQRRQRARSGGRSGAGTTGGERMKRFRCRGLRDSGVSRPAVAERPSRSPTPRSRPRRCGTGTTTCPSSCASGYGNVIADFDFDDTTANRDRQRRQRAMHTDLAAAGQGRVGAQFWSVYVPASLPEPQAVQRDDRADRRDEAAGRALSGAAGARAHRRGCRARDEARARSPR